MAKIEYSAQCLCGGEILLTFTKPTRFEPSIVRTKCKGCLSEFLFNFSVEYNGGQRAYVPEHSMMNITPKLRETILAFKQKQIQENETIT
jgi:hypothetical protein